MKKMRHTAGETLPAGNICFGLDRDTDERSLAAFLQRFSNDALLSTLIPRLTDQEVGAAVDLLSRLMKAHLSEAEYHRLFLEPGQEDEQ